MHIWAPFSFWASRPATGCYDHLLCSIFLYALSVFMLAFLKLYNLLNNMLNSRQKKAKREKKAKGNDLQRLVAELQKQETAWKRES